MTVQLPLPLSPDGEDATRDASIARYLHLTRVEMPRIARAAPRRWPVREDHCFQRIILDALCGGVWYERIPRPAYLHLSAEQAAEAVALCEAIIAGERDLYELNAQSLRWRGKAPRQRP